MSNLVKQDLLQYHNGSNFSGSSENLGVPYWAHKPRKVGRGVLSLRTFLKVGTFFK